MAVESKFNAHRGRYGAPRIHRELVQDGYECSKRRVAEKMQELGLCARNPKKFRNTSRSNPEHQPSKNLLERDFHADAPNKVWVGDITYIHTKSGLRLPRLINGYVLSNNRRLGGIDKL